MQKIKNIILDYGNVIYMIDFDRVKLAFIALGIKNVDEFFGHKAQDPLFDAFDRGEISAADFREGIRERSGKPELSDEQIDNAWNALLIGVPPGKHETLTYLHDKYRTFLLSNNNEIHYRHCMEHIREVYAVPDNKAFFEQTFYSHEMGLRKPEPAIFQEIVRQTGIVAEESLFIDDSPQHLAAAKLLGFQTGLCSAEEPLEYWVEKLNL
ncbi:HAD family phosphatase [Sphingobacterium oryzagri]|uniref:HAD family phosphatase n=1 Tax=Sphingobacterium oryzagri TaxID=3025669 RepID=A0ABY7WCQ5_9SPHI|nr:HAD family phosphatase [Sphingobacterium sp. KACC 22765]WDF66983.1 HAD family phosphatase [Sphingobacterium sp. KACC 22765]